MDNNELNESGFTKCFLQGFHQIFLKTISCDEIGGKGHLVN